MRRYTDAHITATIDATAVDWYSQWLRSVPASAAWKLASKKTA